MQLLEDRILKDGKVYQGNVLTVDSFINHQMDIRFICELGKEFYRLFKDCGITKIVTIEASGIGIAAITAQYFDVPMVFAKKSKTLNISDDFYCAEVESFTHGVKNKVIISKEYINKTDKILLIDDFLANGKALCGLIEIIKSAGAEVVGAGIVIEKGFQSGGKTLREKGIRIESLAIIDSMDPTGGIIFRK